MRCAANVPYWWVRFLASDILELFEKNGWRADDNVECLSSKAHLLQNGVSQHLDYFARLHRDFILLGEQRDGKPYLISSIDRDETFVALVELLETERKILVNKSANSTQRQTILIRPGQPNLVMNWVQDEQPSLTWLQRAVGGSIQLVLGLYETAFGYANGSGLIDNLPVNRGWEDWLPANGSFDYHGNIVIMVGFQLDDPAHETDPTTMGIPISA